MRANLLQFACCPACHHELTLEDNFTELDDEIWQGSLLCQHCHSCYKIHQGMPLLYVDDEVWAPKAREATGWVEYLKGMGIYEQHDSVVDLEAPYYPQEPWIRVSKSFDMALDYLQMTGKERILDLGSGRGWASKQFALLGCDVTALDIIPDENVGLGRAKVIMDHAETHFERVIGDGENLPFLPESFDIVFCCGSLHHSSDLPLLLKNISKVLKPGGRLCAINEPCISSLDDEQAILAEYAAEEIELGINENRPNYIDYVQACSMNGLPVEQAIAAHTNNMSPDNLRVWGREAYALWRGIPVRALRQFIYEAARFLGRDIAAVVKRRWPFVKVRFHRVRHDEIRMQTAILLYCHTELFLVAYKK